MRNHGRRGSGDVVPVTGGAQAVRFDGGTRFVWWGQDDEGHDCVATRAGTVIAFPTRRQCEGTAEGEGWAADPDRSGGGADDAVLDVGPAQDWLSRRRLGLEPGAALDLWNWAADVARSTEQPWHDRGRTLDGCYDRLVAVRAPFVFDLPAYRPRWRPQQLAALRDVLGAAVHVVRVAMPR